MLKKSLVVLLLCALVVTAVACKDDEPAYLPQQTIDDVPNPVVTPTDKDPAEEQDAQGGEEQDNTNLAEYEYFVVQADGKWALKQDKITSATIIEAACEMYYYANRNYQNTNRAFAYSTCSTKPLGSGLLEAKTVEYEVKKGEEYLKYKVQGESIGSKPYGEAIYARIDLANSYYVKVNKGKVSKNWEGSANFTSPAVSQLDKPTAEIYFNGKQEPNFCAAGAVIVPETVLSATIEYNELEGFYTLTFELDMDNDKTTSVILPQMKTNSGDKDAYYKSINETFEIWETGMFKHFTSIDKAKATADLEITYNTYYSYGEQDCDFASYFNNYYKTIKSLCEEANAQ